jgi:queuine tRNA-ribosyltransferase
MNKHEKTAEDTFSVKVIKTHPANQARVTEIKTPHGTFTTPTFMPVGTRAFVNVLTPTDLKATGSQIILGGNTYHMLVSPGIETIRNAGGMHPFMGWTGPMLTDSGGFQVFSLSKNSKICKINESGAVFKHPESGKLITLDAKSSIMTQKAIGADIIMAWDQCTPDTEDASVIKPALERTNRWLLESIEAHQSAPNSDYGKRQALFGIVQGGTLRKYREESLSFLLKQPLDGIAFGGESIGFQMEKTVEILKWLIPNVPDALPRYSMGVGLAPQDLTHVVAEGIDMFDCVAPTRNARHGSVYSGEIVEHDGWVYFDSPHPKSRLNLFNSQYANDLKPIMESCSCSTCQTYSRSYLRYLLKTKANIYFNLACIHNVQVLQDLCKKMQSCILAEGS